MNNEQINNIPNNHKYLTSVIIIFLISFCALIEIKYSFKKINLIKEEYKTQDIISFKKGHFYKHCFDIFIYFTCIIIDINCFIIYIFYISQYLFEHLLKKISMALIYINYIYFGPILFFVVLYSMKEGNNIFFYFDEVTQQYAKLDYTNIFFLFLMVSISFPLTLVFPAISMYIYFLHTIEFKRNGNALLSYLFCYLGVKYSSNIIEQNDRIVLND